MRSLFAQDNIVLMIVVDELFIVFTLKSIYQCVQGMLIN